jgi:DNA topoisomerase 2-associated protein PAT1
MALLEVELTRKRSRLEFDDTYDGLGDQLEEAGDDLNDDTFGGGIEGGGRSQGQTSTEFDFFGQTAQVSHAIDEEHLRYNLLQKPKTSTSTAPITAQKPRKTGYEKYQDPGYIPEIQAKSSVWGTKPQAQHQEEQPQRISTAGPGAPQAKRMMSLAEVEAAMRAQSQPTPLPQHMPEPDQPPSYYQQPPPIPQYGNSAQQQHPMPTQYQPQAPRPVQQHQRNPSRQEPTRPLQPSFQILQNPNRAQHSPQPSQDRAPLQETPPPPRPGQPTPTVPVITHPQQLMQLSEEQRKVYLEEDAKRAKRNHKIFMLSKGNGLMTPQDKNFITRIQLQQLVTATGNAGDADPEAALAEDFYYQVYSQIRGAPRQHPTQPLGHFAQTYLLQTGGRLNNRRQAVNGDNHMQRMQQQVQRAVEAAKLKPKNKQLIIEGSLGKISFSNAKTPKPLLNIKRPESIDLRPSSKKANPEVRSSDRKSVLRNLEVVYQDLMQMEDYERQMPPPPVEGDIDAAQIHMEWRQKVQVLNSKLWQDLKVLEPIVPGSTVPHPFIAFLSFPKGKKSIPRIFRHIDQEQRVTILTMVVVHLDQLDVISRAQIAPGESQPPPLVREEIELFSQVVMPCLLGYVSEAPINIIIGLLGLVLDHTTVLAVAKTKIGLGILTMLLSRAELVKESGNVDDQDWIQWTTLYNRLFDTLEPILGTLFPGPVNTGDDMYIWQFLAAVGIGASPEQQQRLVLGVK